jgi:multicomponent Na+:H+ antiporter subunit E
MVIAGSDRADVLPGIGAALLAGWASMWLMPPDPAGGRVRWFAALRMLGHFAAVSLRAGLDVALRALAPRLRLDPGYALYRPQLPPSDALDLFKAMTSQMPGTIPSGSEASGDVAYHCLDVSQPVLDDLAEEETRLRTVLGGALGSASPPQSVRGDA